jgi:hypothetical protein
MSVIGSFYNKNTQTPSKYTPVTFPVRKAGGQAAQGYLSEFTLNTLFESAFSTGNQLDVTYLLNKFLNVTVTTDNLGVVVPEILTKYGSGKAVGLSGKFITNEAVVKMTPTDNSVVGNLAITVTIDNEEAIYFESNNINAVGQVSSKAGQVFGALSTAHIGDFSSTFRSKIAGMTAATLQAELQAITDKNVAILNGLLKAGITIPTFLGIKISGLVLECGQGVVHGGINVTPATWEGISDLMIAAAEELRYIRRLNRVEEINAAYYAARANV